MEDDDEVDEHLDGMLHDAWLGLGFGVLHDAWLGLGLGLGWCLGLGCCTTPG